MTTTLSLDPSLSCGGYAIFTDNLLQQAGRLTVAEPSLKRTQWERVKPYLRDIEALIAELKGRERVVVIVETPQTHTRGIAGKRSATHLPGYGLIVGATLAYLHTAAPWAELVEVSATKWTRGYPSTHNDTHKTRRVLAVEYLYPHMKGKLGPTTTAGNVADAVLLGDWWWKTHGPASIGARRTA